MGWDGSVGTFKWPGPRVVGECGMRRAAKDRPSLKVGRVGGVSSRCVVSCGRMRSRQADLCIHCSQRQPARQDDGGKRGER